MKHKASLLFLLAVTILFAVALLALLVFAPQLARWYVGVRGMPDGLVGVLLAAFYGCAVPAGVAIACLLQLLRNLRGEQLFSRPNSMLMGIISWCCVAVAAMTLAAGHFYMPLWLVTVTMLFLFLIVRVIRSCFLAATALKEENSLTI